VAESIDFDPVDRIGVGAVGAPGHRQFFLRASSGARTVILSCEKYHVQGLVARIQQILESQGKELEEESAKAAPAESGEAQWTIGELGLGFHESKARFVIVARERGSGEAEGESETEESEEDLATARLWVAEPEMRVFLAQAADLLQAGRPLCPYCGLPIDPAGHPCPAANGSRPII
jgi:uncharacterized repeat protein (TIGR03847 family)